MREDIPAAKHKICIVGFADGHRDAAPWGDAEMEYWGLNRLHAVLPNRKFDRWYDIHSLKRYYVDTNDQAHAKFLYEFDGPVYVRPDDMGLMNIPNERPFPIADILEAFPDYFTNSISWMMAHAILLLAPYAKAHQDDPSQPVPELHVYGVDMAQDQLMQAEYSEQRPSCEYFLGHAAGMGIALFIPDGSDLLTASHRYGFDLIDPIRGKYMSRYRELEQRKQQIQQQLEIGDKQRAELIHGVQQLAGAQAELTYQLRNLMPAPEAAPDVPVAEPQQEITMETLAGAIAHIQGQLAAMSGDELLRADEPENDSGEDYG